MKIDSLKTLKAILVSVVLGSCVLVPNTPEAEPILELTPTPNIRKSAIASFTGKFSDMGYDSDGNGQFEYLQVDVEVNVIETGNFGFLAALTTTSGKLITIGGLTPDFLRNAPVAHATLESGLRNVSIYFEGRAVHSFGANGPYTVSLGLFDREGTSLDSVDFVTHVYKYRHFH